MFLQLQNPQQTLHQTCSDGILLPNLNMTSKAASLGMLNLVRLDRVTHRAGHAEGLSRDSALVSRSFKVGNRLARGSRVADRL